MSSDQASLAAGDPRRRIPENIPLPGRHGRARAVIVLSAMAGALALTGCAAEGGVAAAPTTTAAAQTAPQSSSGTQGPSACPQPGTRVVTASGTSVAGPSVMGPDVCLYRTASGAGAAFLHGFVPVNSSNVASYRAAIAGLLPLAVGREAQGTVSESGASDPATRTSKFVVRRQEPVQLASGTVNAWVIENSEDSPGYARDRVFWVDPESGVIVKYEVTNRRNAQGGTPPFAVREILRP